MKSFDLLYTFSKVSELGSFTKAARALKQPKSRVSRAVHRLEDDVGVQLIKRTTRSMTLTEAGRELFQSIKGPLSELQGSLDSVSGESQISGTIRLSTPEDFGTSLLADLMSEFKEQNPNVRFQINVSNEPADFIGQDLDLAFRIGKFKDSSLVQKKMGNVHLVLVATPQYVKTFGEVKKASDLEKHKILDFSNSDGDSLLERFGGIEKLNVTFTSTSFAMLHHLALKNRGIAVMPDFYVKRPLQAGQFVQVLSNHKWDPSPLSLVYSPTKNMPKRTRAFIDYVSEKVRL